MHIPSQTSSTSAPRLCVSQASPPAPIAKRPLFQDCTTFTHITSHAHLRVQPGTRNHEPGTFLRQQSPRACPLLPGHTFHPSAPSCVSQKVFNASHPRQSSILLALHLPHPRPLTFDLGPLTSFRSLEPSTGPSPSVSVVKSRPTPALRGFGYVAEDRESQAHTHKPKPPPHIINPDCSREGMA